MQPLFFLKKYFPILLLNFPLIFLNLFFEPGRRIRMKLTLRRTLVRSNHYLSVHQPFLHIIKYSRHHYTFLLLVQQILHALRKINFILCGFFYC